MQFKLIWDSGEYDQVIECPNEHQMAIDITKVLKGEHARHCAICNDWEPICNECNAIDCPNGA